MNATPAHIRYYMGRSFLYDKVWWEFARRIAMTKETFTILENYMLSCMEDSVHDKEHIYRVLYNALEIAKMEEGVDYDALICACLLHDI